MLYCSITTAMLNGRAEGPPPEIARFISSYRATGLSRDAAAVVGQAVGQANPSSKARAKALLWAASKLAVYATSVGLEPSVQVWFHPSVIERFTLVGTSEVSAPTRRTLRTNLRHVGVRVLPQAHPPAVALSRERSKQPYSRAEISAYLALADAQPTEKRRMRAGGLICLGAASGLVGRELASVRGSDVICRSGGLVVEVAGERRRVVPVLSEFHERLLASALFAAEAYVIGGVNPNRRNVANTLTARLAGGADLPRLEVARLRATWLATVAEALGLPTFMAAAGVRCSQRIGDVVANLQVAGEAEAVALLGATR